MAATQIEVVGDQHSAAIAPFTLWDGQRAALEMMERERLLVFLKARQLGISWLVCGYALWLCTSTPGQPVLVYSQGQLEANELIRRTSFLYDHHQRRDHLPSLVRDNTGLLEWSNGSRMLSLAATRKAGRSFTAALAILDEWAFMAWPRETLAAVKPTIDAGGKLFIISSADGANTAYHRFWNTAESGASGYASVFLPWWSRPDRGDGWRDAKVNEAGGDTASVLREYPANAIEAFTNASGLVYDVWSDGPNDGNVTEAADYIADGGSVYWAIDDGYEGSVDDAGYFTEQSSPRVVLFIQERSDGTLCQFDESYEIKSIEEQHITRVIERGYAEPEYIAIDSAAAELRGRLGTMGYYTRGKPHRIDESIKAMRRMLAPDQNGRRRYLVHPRCKHFRREMASYRYDPVSGKPIDAFNHGPDAARYFAWTKRLED